MKQITLFILITLVWFGCKSPEKIAAQKAAKEEQARKEENKLLEQTRKKYPCDTITKYYIDTVERVLPGDTTYHNDTVLIRLPGKEITRTEVRTVIDRAREQELENAVKSAQYAAQLNAESAGKAEKELNNMTADRDRLQEGRNTWRWIAIICFALIGGAVVGKLKGLL